MSTRGVAKPFYFGMVFAVCCVVFVEVVAVLFSEVLLERLLIAAFEGEEVGIKQDIDAA